MRGRDGAQLRLLSPIVLSLLSRGALALVSMVGKSYSWILFLVFLLLFYHVEL